MHYLASGQRAASTLLMLLHELLVATTATQRQHNTNTTQIRFITRDTP
ncbi:hypothetical protein PAMC26510_12240 [Caballeronia sordidicola]|uniref:Uncharacterized protein n=1 Tax=Caballeronia sordidicola TaxID=196367 RepID=A0A242MXC8_CABSO|nr:hypothetical protein PAMC26510_12240 [Caballeronia sordidicola]